MSAAPSDRYAVHDALEEMTGYQRSRLFTAACLAVMMLALLIDPHHVLLWVALVIVLVSERAYRRAVSFVLRAPSTTRVRSVTMHSAEHHLLLVIVGFISIEAALL
ncbi:MAG: hypothetical protein IPI32_12080 [Austwickia sp.]|jgi:hypothetical protein|nr:hypothetical protein [Austwickia sp.]MBK8434971.1 hypothetical protein [Austwickia sp.]MBK9101471.1 hypothetical protein [Austwickia sp.]